VVEYLQPPSPGEEVVIVDHDAAWPEDFGRHRARIRAALGGVALEVHHVGSTSVPGLAAKPVIDVALVVADPADEASYVPALVTAGYVLRLREPEWFEHRLLREGEGQRVNLHVFGQDCAEVRRMLVFRDHLRRDEVDRALYERTKRDLASRRWSRVQDYADAKSDVVADIMVRARG